VYQDPPGAGFTISIVGIGILGFGFAALPLVATTCCVVVAYNWEFKGDGNCVNKKLDIRQKTVPVDDRRDTYRQVQGRQPFVPAQYLQYSFRGMRTSLPIMITLILPSWIMR
jgi:hypothetical protein